MRPEIVPRDSCAMAAPIRNSTSKSIRFILEPQNLSVDCDVTHFEIASGFDARRCGGPVDAHVAQVDSGDRLVRDSNRVNAALSGGVALHILEMKIPVKRRMRVTD